jgi:hypothetical protein
MMNMLTALISMLVVEPLQADLADKLRSASAPQAVVTDLSNCARAAAPAMIERATADPWWAASAAIGIWIGTARPGELLVEAAPNCAPAVTAARPFLAKGEG